MSNGPGGPKYTDGGWIRDMMENQAQYNRQVAGVQDPPKGTYGDTWTGGETPPSRPAAIKNPVTRPQMRNEVMNETGQLHSTPTDNGNKCMLFCSERSLIQIL